MHHKILRNTKALGVLPRAYLFVRENLVITHRLLSVVLNVVVNVVCNVHIDLNAVADVLSYSCKQGVKSLGVKPVVRVNHLIEATLSETYSLVYAFSVTSVFLMDSANYVGVILFILVSYLAGFVL